MRLSRARGIALAGINAERHDEEATVAAGLVLQAQLVFPWQRGKGLAHVSEHAAPAR